MTRRTDIDRYTAGDSLLLSFAIEDPVTGGAMNLTGASLKFGLSSFDTGSIAATTTLEKTSPTSGIAITDATNGLCEVTINPGDIQVAGSYWYELQVITSAGASYTVARGRLFAEPAIYPAT